MFIDLNLTIQGHYIDLKLSSQYNESKKTKTSDWEILRYVNSDSFAIWCCLLIQAAEGISAFNVALVQYLVILIISSYEMSKILFFFLNKAMMC